MTNLTKFILQMENLDSMRLSFPAQAHLLGKRLQWDTNIDPPDIKAYALSTVQYLPWKAE